MLIEKIVEFVKSWFTNRSTSEQEAQAPPLRTATHIEDSGTNGIEQSLSADVDEELEELGGEDLDDEFPVSELAQNKPGDDVQSDRTDWQDFLDDLVEIEETPVREELPDEVATDGRIEWERRALQNAIALCEDYNWDADGIRIVSEIFVRYGWNATRRAVERQLRLGLDASELKQAFVVREIWESYPEFGSSSIRYYSPYLSWPIALMIVRSYRCMPDREELEVFLSEAFMRWKWHSHSSHYYSDFFTYLIASVKHASNYSLSYPGAVFDLDRFFRETVLQDDLGHEVDDAISEISGEIEF